MGERYALIFGARPGRAAGAKRNKRDVAVQELGQMFLSGERQHVE